MSAMKFSRAFDAAMIGALLFELARHDNPLSWIQVILGVVWICIAVMRLREGDLR